MEEIKENAAIDGVGANETAGGLNTIGRGINTVQWFLVKVLLPPVSLGYGLYLFISGKSRISGAVFIAIGCIGFYLVGTALSGSASPEVKYARTRVLPGSSSVTVGAAIDGYLGNAKWGMDDRIGEDGTKYVFAKGVSRQDGRIVPMKLVFSVNLAEKNLDIADGYRDGIQMDRLELSLLLTQIFVEAAVGL